MDEMRQWDSMVKGLSAQLSALQRQRDASAPGTELHRMSQGEADQVHWQLRAYQVAGPILDDLYGQLALAQYAETGHRSGSRRDSQRWTKIALGAGACAGVIFLVWGAVGGWWLVVIAIMAVVACMGAARTAVSSYRDMPEGTLRVQLSARIAAIRQACQSCTSQDGYEHVDLILHPRPVGDAVTRLL